MRVEGQAGKAWCILRTAPSRTVGLVKALVAGGVYAWTPQETTKRRAARSKTEKEVVIPLTPSIAFADYEQLPRLVMLSRMPSPTIKAWDEEGRVWQSKSVPPFSVFRYLDAYPRVADRDLDALRIAEQRVRPKGKVRGFSPGDQVKLIGGGFEGLVGTVHGRRGQYTLVTFGNWIIPVAISAINLLPVDKHVA